MNLIALVVVLCFIAAIAYLVNRKYADKIEGWLKFVINLVLVITAVYLVLDATGVWDQVRKIEVPKI